MKFAKTSQYSVAGSCRETDNQILLCRTSCDKSSVLIKNVLQLIKSRIHLLMNIIGI